MIPENDFLWTISTTKHEAIMPQKLSIMLLSSAPKITYYMLSRKCPLFPELYHLLIFRQWCKFIAVLSNGLVTVLLESLTALLEHLNLFDGFVQSTAVKALLPRNASIIPDFYTYLLCLKLCWHNFLIHTHHPHCPYYALLLYCMIQCVLSV